MGGLPWVAPVLLLASLACPTAPAAPNPPVPDKASPPRAGDAVLVEFLLEMPGDDPDGFRIQEDGSWWSYTDRLATVDNVTGKILLHEGHPQWAREAFSLTPEDVEGLRALIRSSGVLVLPSEAPLHLKTEDPGALVRWTFAPDGQAKRVRFHPDLDPMAPALKAVSDRVDSLMDQARRRYLESRGIAPGPKGR